MGKVSAEVLMKRVRELAPHAVLVQEDSIDGGVIVALNMKYDMGMLVPFDNDESDDIE